MGKTPPVAKKTLLQGVRAYASGLRTDDLRGLFRRDAAKAYTVLARDHALENEPPPGPARLLYRLRILFLGFSFRLTPARRFLFAASLFVALLGALDFGLAFDFRGRVVFDASPLWFIFSTAGLTFLLALELVDQVRVRDELEIARQLQRDLLPAAAPQVAGYTLRHTYRTANEVGGDYYDFHRLADGRLAILIGDASGHGIAAGLLMAIANATLHVAIDIDPDPRAVLQLLNRNLVRTGGPRNFMSLFYGLLEPSTGRLEYATAAHPYPLLRRSDGTLSELGSGGLPLGLRAELDLASGETRLEPGDLLVLFSDGLPEAVDSEDRAFGYRRLEKLVAGAQSPQQAHDAILEALDRHLDGAPITDDFCLVVASRDFPLPPVPKGPIGDLDASLGLDL